MSKVSAGVECMRQGEGKGRSKLIEKGEKRLLVDGRENGVGEDERIW